MIFLFEAVSWVPPLPDTSGADGLWLALENSVSNSALCLSMPANELDLSGCAMLVTTWLVCASVPSLVFVGPLFSCFGTLVSQPEEPGFQDDIKSTGVDRLASLALTPDCGATCSASITLWPGGFINDLALVFEPRGRPRGLPVGGLRRAGVSFGTGTCLVPDVSSGTDPCMIDAVAGMIGRIAGIATAWVEVLGMDRGGMPPCPRKAGATPAVRL